MARTTFSRTITETICEVKYIDEHNDIKTGEVVLYADYDINGAQNAARRKLKNNRLIVEKVRHRSYYGSITSEEFAKVCSKSNLKEW